MKLVLCILSDDALSQVSYRFLVSEFSTLILAQQRYFFAIRERGPQNKW